MTQFGMNLREMRLKRGWTQQQLGDKIGKTKNNISQYELGKREPDIEQLTQLAKLFDIPIGRLLDASDSALKEEAAPFYEPNFSLLPLYALLPPMIPAAYRHAEVAPEEIPAFYCYAPEDALFERIKKGDLLLISENPSPVQNALLLLMLDGCAALRRVISQGTSYCFMPADPGCRPIFCETGRFRVLGKVLRAELQISAPSDF